MSGNVGSPSPNPETTTIRPSSPSTGSSPCGQRRSRPVRTSGGRLRSRRRAARSTGWWDRSSPNWDSAASANNPHSSSERLVADADEVTRLGTDRYRVIDRNGDPTIADLTLDDHGHIAQVAVSAEDPQRSGTIDDTQAGYVARYQDETTEPETLDAQIERNVDAAVLDQLDNRPGACGATVSP